MESEAIEEIGVNAPESNAKPAWNAMFVRNVKGAETEKVEASELAGRIARSARCVAIVKDASSASPEVSVKDASSATLEETARFAASERLEETENLEAIVVRDESNVSRAKLVNHEASELVEVIARNVRLAPNASLVENADPANAKSDWNVKVDDLRDPVVTKKTSVIWDEAMPWQITTSRSKTTTMMMMHRSRSRRLSAPS